MNTQKTFAQRKNIDAQAVALEVAEAADSKKAQAITILNLEGISTVTDYFVIASVDNRVQLKALASETLNRLRENGVRVNHIEGYEGSGWILLDCGDVVVHYFLEERREFYGLERLWGDAPRVAFPSTTD